MLNLKVELPNATKRYSDVGLEKQREYFMTPDSGGHSLVNANPYSAQVRVKVLLINNANKVFRFICLT